MFTAFPSYCVLFVLIRCSSCIAANVATAQITLPLYRKSTKETENGSIKSMAPVTLFKIVCTATNFFCTIKPEMMLIILIISARQVLIQEGVGCAFTRKAFTNTLIFHPLIWGNSFLRIKIASQKSRELQGFYISINKVRFKSKGILTKLSPCQILWHI